MCPAVRRPTQADCPYCGMKLQLEHAEGAYVCVTHAHDGAIDIEPGRCRMCERPLEAVETRDVFVCSKHPLVVMHAEAPCPVCEQQPSRQRRAVVPTCPEHGVHLDGDRCPQCSKTLTSIDLELPHGDHTPKHGGIFFMAADRWHHLEATIPTAGTLRLYLYDNYTRPLTPINTRAYARLVYVEEDGSERWAEDSVPLKLDRSRSMAEALDSRFAPPCELKVFVDFEGSGRSEEAFDFAFHETSRVAASRSTLDTSGAAVALKEIDIPETAADIVTAIESRARDVARRIDTGHLGEVYLPALEARTLALAIADKLTLREPTQARGLARASEEIVRGAWLLDLHGDAGDGDGVAAARAVFEGGVERLRSVVSSAVSADTKDSEP